jgi:hypothetical protein
LFFLYFGSSHRVFAFNPLESVNNLYVDETPSFFIEVIDGEAILEFDWVLDIEIELDSLLDNVSGTVDFLNTMKFGDFTAFDADMNVIDDAMIVGSAGKVFSTEAVTTVPTPGSPALMTLGLLLITTFRKRLA